MQQHDLDIVRIPYVVIAMVVIAVLVVFAISKMPDTGHEEDPIHILTLLKQLCTGRYLGGVVAQAFYVAAQIMCWTFVIHYGVNLLGLEASVAQNWNIAAMVTFLTGRWFGTLLVLKHFQPGMVLGLYAIAAAITTLGAIYVPGIPGIVCVVVISLFMSVMFPTIYGLALDGLTPNHAKLGSAGLIFAIVGGALMPPLQGGIIDTGNLSFGPISIPLQWVHSETVRASFVLPLICFVAVAMYGFNMVGREKKATA